MSAIQTEGWSHVSQLTQNTGNTKKIIKKINLNKKCLKYEGRGLTHFIEAGLSET